jgi:uncharacterized protein (TIGR03086 family)
VHEPVLDALAQARRELGRRLPALRPDDWPRPTPCTEWNTRQLVNHVVGVQFRVARLLAGGSKEVYVATREDDWLGRDHLAAWARAVTEFDASLAVLHSFDVGVDYRVPLTAREAIRLTAFDTAVHSWDISRAIGFDEDLDPQLTAFALEALEFFLSLPGLAAFFAAPQNDPPAEASDQTRLLHLAGRL